MLSRYIFLICFQVLVHGSSESESEESMPNVNTSNEIITLSNTTEAVNGTLTLLLNATNQIDEDSLLEEESVSEGSSNSSNGTICVNGNVYAVGKIVISATCGRVPALPLNLCQHYYQPRIIPIPIYVIQSQHPNFDCKELNAGTDNVGNTDNDNDIDVDVERKDLSFGGYVPAAGKVLIVGKY